MTITPLRTVSATRYITPLREGGSLPGIVEADDDGTYVLKFRGAGQGIRVLVAELIVGELARYLGFRMPELVFAELDAALGRAEPDFEIQELIKASVGLNLAMDYLPGSMTFDPLVTQPLIDDQALAARLVWFDALTTNVDRTARNANLLVWHKQLWLIDHGAALFFHHSWKDWQDRAKSPFNMIKDHVLLPFVTVEDLERADAELAPQLNEAVISEIVNLIPDEWLGDVPELGDVTAHRQAYIEYFCKRLEAPRAFAQEASRARLKL